jgi:four helix bundle protein
MVESRPNQLLEKSFQFSLAIVNICYQLQDDHKEYVLSKQLIRSGTAIGALSEEAQQAESKADFIHKLSIANKEAHESHYWLRLIKESKRFQISLDQAISDCNELKRMLVSIIKSSKNK